MCARNTQLFQPPAEQSPDLYLNLQANLSFLLNTKALKNCSLRILACKASAIHLDSEMSHPREKSPPSRAAQLRVGHNFPHD